MDTSRQTALSLFTELSSGGTPQFEEVFQSFLAGLPMLAQLEDTPQDPEWHAEGNVYIHSRMTMNAMYQMISEDRFEISNVDRARLLLSSALHDLAKVITTREREIEGTIRIIAPRHAELGRSYLVPRLVGLGLPISDILAIADLIGYHHHPRRLIYRDLDHGAYWRLQRQVNVHSLLILCEADVRGRTSSTADQLHEDHEMFSLLFEEYQQGMSPMSDEWTEIVDEALDGAPLLTRTFIQAQGVREAELGLISTPYEVISRSYGYRERFAQLHIISAPSGSGKTSWIAKHHPDGIVISLDDLRQEVTGSITDQSKNGQVLQLGRTKLKRLLTTSNKIIWDATSIRQQHRTQLIELAYQYHAFVRIDVLCASIDVALTRNLSRERQLPQSVIEDQYRRWEWPTRDEAHDVHYWFIDETGEWTESP